MTGIYPARLERAWSFEARKDGVDMKPVCGFRGTPGWVQDERELTPEQRDATAALEARGGWWERNSVQEFRISVDSMLAAPMVIKACIPGDPARKFTIGPDGSEVEGW